MLSDSLAGQVEFGEDDRALVVDLKPALDHPDTVSHLAVLDIVPTMTIYEKIDQQHATTMWRYFFLAQPHDLPERMIAGDPGWHLRWTLGEWCGTPGALADRAVAEYERCFDDATNRVADGVHGSPRPRLDHATRSRVAQ